MAAVDDDMDLFINVNTELIDGTMIGNRSTDDILGSKWRLESAFVHDDDELVCPCLVFDQLVSTKLGRANYNSLM